jgi:hypothetical protein
MIKEDNNAQFYINKLKNGEYFSFTRWGDGEWFCTVGVNGQNCDGHRYFPEMSSDLQKALKNNKGYYKAVWPTTHGQIQRNLPLIQNYLKTNEIDVNWVNAIVWEDLVIREDINELTDTLGNMNFVIVSEASKRDLPIKYIDFIEIPKVNCYLEKDRIKNDMIAMTEKYDNVVFGLSASMMTNAIVDELYDVIGNKCWMIDFGSIWDPFIGNNIRSYHREYKKIEL